MATDRQTLDAELDPDLRLAHINLSDLEAVRLILRGGSVIDWHRLDFRDDADVDRFLRVNEIDPQNELDLHRLEDLREEAVDYLRSNFNFRIPEEVAHGEPVRALFLMASKKGPFQVPSCIVLKVMHIIHHLAGRELLFRLPISDDEVFGLVERRVVGVVEEIRAAGHPIIEFQWSRKPRSSLITKLLAKRSTLAANVYDKLRFRLVVKDQSDILPLLLEMVHRLIPFNYVVPGESVNEILNFPQVLDENGVLQPLAKRMQKIEADTEAEARRSPNEFSGPGYRIINFVADVPVRLEDVLCRVEDPDNQEFGPIVFVLTEFQVADQKTARENEAGENSHSRYKARQLARVKQRLVHGFPPSERPSTANDDGGGKK